MKQVKLLYLIATIAALLGLVAMSLFSEEITASFGDRILVSLILSITVIVSGNEYFKIGD